MNKLPEWFNEKNFTYRDAARLLSETGRFVSHFPDGTSYEFTPTVSDLAVKICGGKKPCPMK